MPQSPEPQTYSLPSAAPYTNHGKTKAAWTLMWGICLGVLVVGLGLILQNNAVEIAGVVIVVVALVASQIMRGMGLGQPAAASAPSKEPDWYGA
ncbi:HGxxPAAW family protein [Georgenia sp. SYP-B2076]|uniref:HGxxPAAW family protein n=1 Tax=Georgenia sp. SYP-B2076 TaxID=2495881 RepID=UPI000F8E78DD|nr:HGxxPAAW family protein [Georgenia sp. SYP-B2076]